MSKQKDEGILKGRQMKLTVLADNNTIIVRYYLGEPALSLLLEDDGEKILFDTGYSDVFIRNASVKNYRIPMILILMISRDSINCLQSLLSESLICIKTPCR